MSVLALLYAVAMASQLLFVGLSVAFARSGWLRAFRVHAAGKQYWGICIWDALGIAAALDQDARISAPCGDCGETLHLEIDQGTLVRAVQADPLYDETTLNRMTGAIDTQQAMRQSVRESSELMQQAMSERQERQGVSQHQQTHAPVL